MQDLSSDIIGTNPTQPKIINHDWLTPDPKTYDNYPSDNNPVRILPKLSEMWNYKNTGINLVPGLTVQSLGSKSTESRDAASVVREAKKAMMAGITGKDLVKHIRARFTENEIASAKDDLIKLSEESGLLGNVYIDISAFSTPSEAEQFMAQHRNRLARDIVVNGSTFDPNVIAYLASKFRKNVKAEMKYDKETLEGYKNHLVALGRIDKNFVVDSKESLRQAFLMEPVVAECRQVEKKQQPIKEVEVTKALSEKKDKEAIKNKIAEEEMTFRKVFPILSFAREQASKGKTGVALKEMLLKKYARADLNEAAKFFPAILKEKEASGMSNYIAKSIKELIQKFPIKETSYVKETKVEKPVGVKASLYPLLGNVVSSRLDDYCRASVEALRKGFDIYDIRTKLMKELSLEEADKVASDALTIFNASPAGVKANPPVKKIKKKIVPDLPKKETLPSLEKTAAQTKEIMDIFKNADRMIVDIDPPVESSSVKVRDLSNRTGLDNVL